MKQHSKISTLLLGIVSATSFLLSGSESGSATGQEAEAIRWNLNSGEKLQVTLEQKTEIATNIDTRQKRIGSDMLLIIDWQIENVENDRIEMSQSIKRVKLEVRRPNKTATETILIDTASRENPTAGLASQLQAQIENLMGTKFDVVMTTRGEILEVSIPETSKEKVRLAPASMLLRQLLTQEGLKEMLGQSSIVFPETSEDNEWQMNVQLNNAMGKITKETAIKYEGEVKRDDRLVHGFVMTAQAKLIETAESADAPVLDSYSGSGRAWFSTDSDTVYGSEFENRINVTRRYRDQKIVSSVSTTNEMRVVRK